MSNMNENNKEQIQEIPNIPINGLTQEEFSKSILIDVGHNKIPNKLFKAYLDVKKYTYYAPTFGLFAGMADKLALTWNLFAFFMPSFWLLYRKMYVYAVIAFLSTILVSFAGFWISDTSVVDSAGTVSNAGIAVEVLVGFVVNIIIGLTGNYLYFFHSKKILLHIMNTVPIEQQEDAARLQGGTNALSVWVISIICIVSYLLFTYAILK